MLPGEFFLISTLWIDYSRQSIPRWLRWGWGYDLVSLSWSIYESIKIRLKNQPRSPQNKVYLSKRKLSAEYSGPVILGRTPSMAKNRKTSWWFINTLIPGPIFEVYCQGFSTIEIIWWWMIGTVMPSSECSRFDIKEFAFLQSWSQYPAVSQAWHASHYPGRVGCVAHFCKQPLRLLLTWHVDAQPLLLEKCRDEKLLLQPGMKQSVCFLSPFPKAAAVYQIQSTVRTVSATYH